MNHRNRFAGILVGLVFVAVGVYLFGWAAGFWNYFLFDGWWTLFLIVPGVALMVKDGVNMGNTILTVLGVLLLLNEQDVFDHVHFWPIVWAALLICAGVGIITGQFKRHRYSDPGSGDYYKPGTFQGPQPDSSDNATQGEASSQNGEQPSGDTASGGSQGNAGNQSSYQNPNSYQSGYASSEDYPVHTAIFSGLDIKNHSYDLKGADLTAVFGGIDMDFSQSKVNRNITIKATSIFGGVNIVVPQGIFVRVDASSIFGGYDNHVVNPVGENLPLVVIKATSIFGGVDVK